MTRRLGLLARKDYRDAMRERQLYYLGTVFALIGLGIGYLAGSSGVLSGDDLSEGILLANLFLAPLATLILSHDGVSAKLTDGELTVLLGLPFSRSDVVLGTAIGRFAVVATMVVANVVVASIVSSVLGTVPEMGTLLAGTAAVLVLTLVFTGLAVGFSALARTTTQSTVAAFGVFVLFVFRFWEAVPAFLNVVLDYLDAPTIPSEAIDVYVSVVPYAAARNAFEPISRPVAGILSSFAAGSVPASPAAYEHPVFAALLVVAWIGGPLALGYAVFDRKDL